MSNQAGKGDTYRKVDSKKWFDNYGEIRWRSKQKQKKEIVMRTEMRLDKFGSDLNKWIYDEQVKNISVSNVDCVISYFSPAGDTVKLVEFKHTNEPDRPMQDVMLHRLAERLKVSNQMSSTKFGVFKIRGELPFTTVELYDYMSKETKTLTNAELKVFVGDRIDEFAKLY
jgi:hypothetical protein